MKKFLYALYIALPLFISSALFAQTNNELPAESRTRIGNFNGPSESPFSLFPLPSTGIITIAFNEQRDQSPDVEVYDLLGNRIASMKAVYSNDNNYMIDLSDKKPGYYFLKIATDGKVYTRRITIRP